MHICAMQVQGPAAGEGAGVWGNAHEAAAGFYNRAAHAGGDHTFLWDMLGAPGDIVCHR